MADAIFFRRRKATTPFPHVSASIRLAHKYKMTSICDEGMKLLITYYDARYDFLAYRDGLCALEAEPVHSIHAIHITYLTGADILPLAFLQCARVGPDLVLGYGREDGTRIFLTPGTSHVPCAFAVNFIG